MSQGFSGLWRSGNAAGFGPAVPGSTPGSPNMATILFEPKVVSTITTITLIIFACSFTLAVLLHSAKR